MYRNDQRQFRDRAALSSGIDNYPLPSCVIDRLRLFQAEFGNR